MKSDPLDDAAAPGLPRLIPPGKEPDGTGAQAGEAAAAVSELYLATAMGLIRLALCDPRRPPGR